MIFSLSFMAAPRRGRLPHSVPGCRAILWSASRRSI